jgi:hypothetical protein
MRREKIDSSVLATYVLHSFLREHTKLSYMPTNFLDMEQLDTGEVITGDWGEREALDDLQHYDARNASQEAKQCSLQYKNYFMNEEQVS